MYYTKDSATSQSEAILVSYRQLIEAEFDKAMARFHNSQAIQRLNQGEMTPSQYAGIIRQVSHQARENPQLQALACSYVHGSKRQVVKGFFKHAASEIGHDTLAANDVEAMGGCVQTICTENPLPETTALTAYAFSLIRDHNPVGYLGYLYFLEFLPTQAGSSLMDALEKSGISRKAMSFLQDHSTIDVGHNRLMEEYIDQLVLDDSDCAAMINAIEGTSTLYCRMLDAGSSKPLEFLDFGDNPAEVSDKERIRELVSEVSPSVVKERLSESFDAAMHDVVENCHALQLLATGQIDRDQYASVLEQWYFQTRDNPQLQAEQTVYYRGKQRQLIKLAFQHAASEVGHHLMALDDLSNLGSDVDAVSKGRPLPATAALVAYPRFQMRNRNPVGYLGYLYFLEHLPTQYGEGYLRSLKGVGLPENAMSFIFEHVEIDVHHNRLMEQYAEGLILTESDLREVEYAIRVTGRLYRHMLDDAIATQE